MNSLLQAKAELNTWKKIAECLGVSVRQAQHWEKNDGMPVHRMPGKKRHVWAYTSELEAWKLRIGAVSSVLLPEILEPAAVANSQPADGTDASPKGRISRRAFGRVAGLAAVSVAGAAWLLRRPTAALARAGVVENALCAWDTKGSLLWQHPFRESLKTEFGGTSTWGSAERRAQVVDLAGDGRRQVIFFASFPPVPDSPERHELYCFSGDGTMLWRYRPEFTLRFGDERFAGPWYLHDMVFVQGRPNPALYVAGSHNLWHPGFVLQIDIAGTVSLKFVMAGQIYALKHISNPSGNYLLAGGINNEYNAAALAVLNEAAPPSRSPQTRGSRFEALDGPAGEPDRYFLFPPTELNAVCGQPYNEIKRIRGPLESLIAYSEEVPPETSARVMSASAMYRFTTAIEPADVAFDDSWAADHRHFQSEGKLKHSLAQCPQLKRPIQARRWDSKSGWRTVNLPIASGVGPGAYQALLTRYKPPFC